MLRTSGGGNPSLGLDLTRFWGVEESEKKNKPSFFSAFTLAEMMVVMLILSIVLAAMAPVMTTRNKPNNSSPWQYQANNRSNAWFGAGSAQHAMIGQSSYGADDTIAKLLITVGDDTTNFLAFKRNNTNIGRLFIGGTNLLLGNLASGTLGDGSVGVGRNLQTGANSTAVGSSINASGEKAVAIGSSVTASGANAIAIGNSFTAASDNSIGIGAGADPDAADTIAIGRGATIGQGRAKEKPVDAQGAIAIGASSRAQYDNSIAIGKEAKSGNVFSDRTRIGGSIAIGVANALSTGAIAIGDTANASLSDSIAIGYKAIVENPGDYSKNSTNSIAVGSNSLAQAQNAVAIGYKAKVEGKKAKNKEEGEIAIGYGATLKDATRGIAIGQNAGISGSGYYNEDGSRRFDSDYAAESVAIGYNAKGDCAEQSVIIGSNASINSKVGSSTPGTSADIGITDLEKKTMDGGIAIGYKATIVGTQQYSTAIGPGTYAARGSVAIGSAFYEPRKNAGTNAHGNTIYVEYGEYGASATGVGSVAIGPGASAPHAWSTAIGAGAKAEHGNQIVLGTEEQTVYIPGNLVVGKYAVLGYSGNYRTVFKFKTSDENNWWLRDIHVKGGRKNDMEWGDAYNGEVSGFPSDRRLKYVGKENKSGLDKIRQLKIFNYTYKKDTTKTPHVGVIAQDLQKVFPNAVKKGADGFLTIRMEDMFYAVINAIKELDAKYQAQEKRITAIEKENKELKARLDRLEAKVK